MKKIIIFLLLQFMLIIIYSEEIKINFPKENNYRQTYNDCALYSIKTVLKILNNKEQKIEVIRSNIKERLKNNYTLPWGIENYLKKNKIKINVINYSNTGNNNKIT